MRAKLVAAMVVLTLLMSAVPAMSGSLVPDLPESVADQRAAPEGSGGPRPVQRNVDTNEIPLRVGVIDVGTAGENLLKARSLPQDGGYYLVHFSERPDRGTAERFVAAISAENVVGYVPPNTYICRLDSFQMASVDAIDGVDWVGLWKPEYKTSPTIETQNRTTLGPGDAESNYLSQPVDDYVVTFFRGEDPAAYRTQIEELGGIVRSHVGERMSITIDASRLPALAGLSGVYWIEKDARMVPQNDSGTWIVQSYLPGVRTVFDNGYTGEGQIVAVSDTGIDVDHLMFWDSSDGLPDHTYDGARRKVVSYYNWQQTGTLTGPAGEEYYDPGDGYFDPTNNVYDWDLNRGHGSHVAGTVAGEWPTGVTLPTWSSYGITGTAGYDFYEGNAYGAKLVFQDLSRPDSQYLYPPPDLNNTNPVSGTYPGSVGLFPQAMMDGAYIHSNSWGGGEFGEYSAYSRDIDEMMWENPDFLVIFSNGNDGNGTPGTITPPATAKNCLSIGASETSDDGYGHDSENVADFSSWGPTGWYGRVKPDVCAPGYWTFSAENDDATDGSLPNDGLIGYAGTSMAAPAVAGASALAREYFMTGGYQPVAASGGFMPAGSFTPSAALVKAIMVNSAEPMSGLWTGGTIPGYGQGWGRMLLDNALYFPGDSRSLLVDDNRTGLDSEAAWYQEYTITVASGAPLDVVAVYTDPPADAGSIAQMINWLYVEVDHPNGSDYWLSGRGNFANGESVLNPVYVYSDVVQKVRINDPDPGVYSIYVVAFETDQVTPGWNVQPYALAVSGNLVQSKGYVQFDQDFYGTTGPLNMTLSDADLAGTGSAAVSLTSSSTGDTESNVVLSEVGSTGLFTGTFPADPVAGTSPDDGTLNVADPDTLTVTYNDASPVGVITDTAAIDGSPPVISNVADNACNGSSAEITWDTDEVATTIVHWGPTVAYGNEIVDARLSVSHFAEFDGLEMGQTYYYEVCSADEAGNSACSGPHSFVTPHIYTPSRFHVGYVGEDTVEYDMVNDDDDMWTGHNTWYAGIRHGFAQFDLSELPYFSLIESAELILFKQDSVFDDMQASTWSANLIQYTTDISDTGSYASVHSAPIQATLVPTWTTAELDADAPGTVYTLTVATAADLRAFNQRPSGLLTFRMDGPVTGDDIVSWDTGYRQDLGSLGVCYKPQLIITYRHLDRGIYLPLVLRNFE